MAISWFTCGARSWATSQALVSVSKAGRCSDCLTFCTIEKRISALKPPITGVDDGVALGLGVGVVDGVVEGESEGEGVTVGVGSTFGFFGTGGAGGSGLAALAVASIGETTKSVRAVDFGWLVMNSLGIELSSMLARRVVPEA